MNTLYPTPLLSLQKLTTETLPASTFESGMSHAKCKQSNQLKPIGNSKKDRSTAKTYVVDYGPITVRHRRTATQTMATGRRSKRELAAGEDAMKHELQRVRNRMAARELKKSRDQIELDLIKQIKNLEDEKKYLEAQHKELKDRHAQLNRDLYNAKQTRLVPFIIDTDIFLSLAAEYDYDSEPLLEIMDEQFDFLEF